MNNGIRNQAGGLHGKTNLQVETYSTQLGTEIHAVVTDRMAIQERGRRDNVFPMGR
jgi:hypothetical protein